jgi:hypothetical protein
MKLELKPEKFKGYLAPVHSDWGVDWKWLVSFAPSKPPNLGGRLHSDNMYSNLGIRTYGGVK